MRSILCCSAFSLLSLPPSSFVSLLFCLVGNRPHIGNITTVLLCSVFCPAALCCACRCSHLTLGTAAACFALALHAASLWATVTGPLSCSFVVAAALSGPSAVLPLYSDCYWHFRCRSTLLEVQCPCLNWGLLLVESHDNKKIIKNGFHLRSRCVLNLLSSESHILGVEVAQLLLRTSVSS